MKPRTILLLAFLIFACVIGCVMGNFGNGITLMIEGQPVVFTAFIPVISVPAEMIGRPWFYIGDTPIGLYNTLFTTLIVDAVIVVLALLGRRGLGGIKPKTWFANAWEAYVELLYERFIVPSLGIRARVVLPIAVTIFTFIMIAGFFELVPGHESIGELHAVPEEMTQNGYCVAPAGPAYILTGQKVVEDFDAECPFKNPSGASGSPEVSLASDTLAAPGAAAEGGAPKGYAVIAFLRRPTSDLSTTLALALVAFIFIEIQGIRANGSHYFERFFNIGALKRGASSGGMSGLVNYIIFGVGFLELLSEFIRIISFSFRLFGNMFAGTVLVFVMGFILPLVLPTAFLGLEFAIAIIQAFVFMMLITVFTSLAVAHTEH